MEPIHEDQEDSGFVFANEMFCQIHDHFAFILNPRRNDFQGIFWTSTFLSPMHKMMMETKGNFPMEIIRKVLQGEGLISYCLVNKLGLLFRIFAGC